MTTKLMLDVEDDLWDKVKIYKIKEGLNSNNEAVVKLIREGLKQK